MYETNCMCMNKECVEEIDSYCNNIVNALINGSKWLKSQKCFKNSATGIIWDSQLKILKQKSIDIHELWRKVGKSRCGVINSERLHVKSEYKSYLKRQKQQFLDRRKQEMAFYLSSHDSKSFWKKWHNMQKHSNIHNDLCIGGVYDPVNIRNNFKEFFGNNFVNS